MSKLNMQFEVRMPSGAQESFWIKNINTKKISKNFKDEINKENSPIKKIRNTIQIPSDTFDLCRRVPDSVKFIIRNNEVLEVNTTLNKGEIKHYKDKKKIIIILESPHRDELVAPMYPAKGYTGRNIEKLLNTYLQLKQWENLAQEEINIIVMNRIPYQTSLGSYYTGALDGYIRSTIFLEMWKNNLIKTDFLNRLSECVNEKDLIINACTKLFLENKERDKDKQGFDSFLKQHFPNNIHMNLSHPASWGIHIYK